MQGAIQHRLSGISLDTLPQDVRFLCTLPVEPPEAIKDIWISDDGIGNKLVEQLSWPMMETLSSMIIVCDPNDEANAEEAARLAQWLSTDQVAPPVLLLPIRSPGSRPVATAKLLELCKGAFDDIVLGEPCGYALALALHALVVRAESKSDKWGDELHDRLTASEDLQSLKDQVEGTMWNYLPQRLMLALPPIDYGLGDLRAKEFAGYAVREQLPFGVDELMYQLRPPAGVPVAIGGEMVKVVPKSSLARSVDALRRMHRAWQLAQALSARWAHPNIARSFQIYHAPTCLYIRMELAGTESLFHRLQSRGPSSLSADQHSSLIAQLASVVDHLHRGPNICHRSIKPESVVLTEAEDGSLRLKLINFDTAAVQLPGGTCKLKVGTFPFVAPEVGGGRYDGFAADMWSFGILLLELVCGVGVVEETICSQLDGPASKATSGKAFPVNATRRVAEALSDELRLKRLLSERCGSTVGGLAHWLGLAAVNLTRIAPAQRWTSERMNQEAKDILKCSVAMIRR